LIEVVQYYYNILDCVDRKTACDQRVVGLLNRQAKDIEGASGGAARCRACGPDD
jgi:hypothetical protein